MTIAGAIDKINDKLAGTDKYAPVTIEGALDKLAETIPEGGWGGSTSAGGIHTVLFAWVDDTNISAFGDFQTALDIVKGGEPVIAYVSGLGETSGGYAFTLSTLFASTYETSNPNAIQFWESSSTYYEWTENGVVEKTA